MGICQKNLTIIVRTFRREAILRLEGNTMKGVLGSKWDTVLGKNRKCRLVAADQLGIQVSPDNATSTGVFTGALGMLQRSQGDFLFNRYSQYFKKEFFEHSAPILSEQ